MIIQYQKSDSGFYAINPQIERRADQMIMKLDEQSCTHFLIFSHSPHGKVDITEASIQKQLEELNESLLNSSDVMLSENTYVSCVNYREYRMNDYAINLSPRIAEYSVYGCRLNRQEDPERLIISLPEENVDITASVSLTVHYSIKPFVPEVKKSIFGRKNEPDVPQVWVVDFDDIPNYEDGGIVYQIEGLPLLYPITSQMIGGRKFYISSGSGKPRFESKISGLTIKEV